MAKSVHVIICFRLLDVDYESGFQCGKCGPQPEVVVMDGICLGMQKTYMPPSEPLNESEQLDGR